MRQFKVLLPLILIFAFNQLKAQAWVNEIHYDNIGSDTHEGFEILIDTSQVADSSIFVQLYNGKDSLPYGAVLGIRDASLVSYDSIYLIAWFSIKGLQNGPNDGIFLFQEDSLIKPLQFLSYEGQLLAQGGKASGMESDGLSISQNALNPIGYSMQLQGEGSNYQDFQWVHGQSSRGLINSLQDLKLLRRISNDAYFKIGSDSLGAISYIKHLKRISTGAYTLDTIWIHDGLGSDLDTLPLKIPWMSFEIQGYESIKEIEFEFQGKPSLRRQVNQGSIQFSNLDLKISDNDSLYLLVRLVFAENQIDKRAFGLEVNRHRLGSSSSQFHQEQWILVDPSKSWVEVEGTRLSCLNCSEPFLAGTGQRTLKLRAIDSLSNLDSNFHDSIKVHISNFQASTYLNNGSMEIAISTASLPANKYAIKFYRDTVLIGQDSLDIRRVHGKAILISGVYDGPLAWGRPKGIELMALDSIMDLSHYAIGVANNGLGSDGVEVFLPSKSLSPGEYFHLSYDSISFQSFFGFAPDFISGHLNINGDDAIELYHDSTGRFQGIEYLIDGYGNPDSSETKWSYQDAWAYRRNLSSTAISQTEDWLFSQSGKFSGAPFNDLCTHSFPVESFSPFKSHDFSFHSGEWHPYEPKDDLSDFSALIMEGTCLLKEDLRLSNLEIRERSRLSIDSLITLQIHHRLENYGELILEDGSQLILDSSATLIDSGSCQLKKWSKLPDHRRFVFWSSPMVNIVVKSVFGETSNIPSNDKDWYSWDHNTQNWQARDSSYILEKGLGFLSTPGPQFPIDSEVQEKRVFEGVLNHGQVEVLINYQMGDYLLIGNPYAASISKAAFMRANPSLDGNFYEWDNQLTYSDQGYAVWSSHGSIRAGINGFLPDSMISSVQSVFVRASQPGQRIVFRPEMQRTNLRNSKKAQSLKSYRLSLWSKTSQAEMLLVKPNASTSNASYKGALWKEDGSTTALAWEFQGEKFAIASLDISMADTLDLYLRLDSGRNILSWANPENLKSQVFLLDRLEDRLDLFGLQGVPIHSDHKQDCHQRFALVFSKSLNLINQRDSCFSYEIRGNELWWNTTCGIEFESCSIIGMDGKKITSETFPINQKKGVIRNLPLSEPLVINFKGPRARQDLKLLIKP